MKLGLHCNRFTWEGGPPRMGATLKSIAQRLEENGFYSLSVMDHFFQIAGVGPPNLEMNEAYTTLGFVAGATERLRLGTIVTGVTYRHPGFLIKQVTTLDVLSGGRSWFGIGAAWYEREHVGLGIPFPPVAERFRRLEETLQIALHMWSADNTPYEGRYYQLLEPLCSPQPLQKPHPPVMVGGGGEQKTLRLVARYADACNIGGEPDVIKHKLDVLREHCEAEGRRYDAIEKTTNTNLAVSKDGANGTETPAQLVARLKKLRELGITWVSGRIPNVDQPGTIELLGKEVVPAVAEL
ncbi:MAG TPA: LLM class F420-dependent oxidoreductase [Chloroflexota bacterium]|nr:LLM class F420-dependent oxidoreductase [Chloroflexota bacterium]